MEKTNKSDVNKKAEYITNVDKLIDAFNDTEESKVLVTVKKALNDYNKEKEYYINKDGSVYIKNQ